jgi:hypothetical protein
MNRIKEHDGTPRFIRLQVADKMPEYFVAPYLKNLGVGFLNAILAQVLRTGFNGSSQQVRRVSLAHGDERYQRRVTPRSARALFNPAINLRKASAYFICARRCS